MNAVVTDRISQGFREYDATIDLFAEPPGFGEALESRAVFEPESRELGIELGQVHR